MPSDPADQYLWRGISVYDSVERARKKALGVPMLGRFIAVLSFEDHLSGELMEGVRIGTTPTGTLFYARTTKGRGHYTLWGSPLRFLDCVQSVVPVAPDEH